MANRFLDTNFFKSPFVKKLKGELKTFYIFIFCDCTPAGMWFLDLDGVAHFTKFQITIQDFEQHFVATGKAIKVAPDKYFFPDFIEHQYPHGLSDNNKAHKNILLELRKLNLLDDNGFPKKEAPLESPLKGSLEGGQGIGIGIGAGQGIGQGQSGDESPREGADMGMLIPRMQSIWYQTIPTYTRNVGLDYPAIGDIRNFIAEDAKLGSVLDSEVQEKIINTFQLIANEVNTDDFWRHKPLKSIASNIQEFYNRIKSKADGTSEKPKRATSKPTTDDLKASHARRYSSGQQAGN